MTDSEITRRCAEAMGWKYFHSKHGHWEIDDPNGTRYPIGFGAPKFDPYSGEKLAELTAGDALIQSGYAPLFDDAQAMALWKRFKPNVYKEHHGERFMVSWRGYEVEIIDDDLNRAICLCIGQMQTTKK